MYLERMVLMNLNGNGEGKRGKAKQVSINVFSAESGTKMNYRRQKSWGIPWQSSG